MLPMTFFCRHRHDANRTIVAGESGVNQSRELERANLRERCPLATLRSRVGGALANKHRRRNAGRALAASAWGVT